MLSLSLLFYNVNKASASNNVDMHISQVDKLVILKENSVHKIPNFFLTELAHIKKFNFSVEEKMRMQLQNYFRNKGYKLTTVKLKKYSNTLEYDINIPKYSKVNIKAGNLSLLGKKLYEMKAGDDINIDNIYNANVIANSLPGVHADTVLSPGLYKDTSNLDISLNNLGYFQGSSLSFDNYGQPYTGELRLNGTLNVNNLFHNGDNFNITATSSLGFNTGTINYSQLLDSRGDKGSIYYNAYNYTIGEGISPFNYAANKNVLSALGFSGYGQSFGTNFLIPVYTGYNNKISAKLGYSMYILSDTYNVSQGIVDDRYLQAMDAELDGTSTFSGGANVLQYIFAYMPFFDTVTSNTNPLSGIGGFHNMWHLSSNYTQVLPGVGNSLYLEGFGQLATGNIDPTQQYLLGGETNVRAYPTAIFFGNSGYLGTTELRHAIQYNWGVMQPYASFDVGGAYTTGETLTLMGPGVGVSAATHNGWNAKFEINAPIGNIPGVIGSVSPLQGWVSVGKTF